MKKIFCLIFFIYIIQGLRLISGKIKEYPSARYLSLKKQRNQKKNSLNGLFGKRNYLNNIKQNQKQNQNLQIFQDNRRINLNQQLKYKDPLSNIRYVSDKRKLKEQQSQSQQKELQSNEQQSKEEDNIEQIKEVYNNNQNNSDSNQKQLLLGQKQTNNQQNNQEQKEEFLNHQEKDIKTLVISALKGSKDSNPIIIINQPDESSGNLSVKEQQYIPEKQNYMQIYEQIDLNTVDILIQIITNLENIYDAYYKHFPTYDKKLEWIDQNYKFKNDMQKLNNFARQVISKSHLIMKDLNFYENRVKLMEKGEQNMMKFFFLETKYKRLQLQTNTLNDGFVQQAWKNISKNASEYDEMIDFIQENSIKLYRFNQYFADNIKSITKTYSLSDTVLDNFDQVMKFSVKLLEIKQELEQVLSDLKVHFVKFHLMKQETASLLFQMDRLVSAKMTDIQKTQKQKEEKQKKELDKENKEPKQQ